MALSLLAFFRLVLKSKRGFRQQTIVSSMAKITRRINIEAAELDRDKVMDVRVKSDTYGVKPVHYVAFTDKATGIRYSCEVNRRTGEIPTMGASQA